MKQFFLLVALLAAPLAAADFSGEWVLDGDVAGNAIKGSCALKQTGAKISGICKLQGKPDADATGEAGEDKITFEHKVEHDGTIYTLQYSGKLAGAGALKGDIAVPDANAHGFFTATKR